jgi:hypothetical protein
LYNVTYEDLTCSPYMDVKFSGPGAVKYNKQTACCRDPMKSVSDCPLDSETEMTESPTDAPTDTLGYNGYTCYKSDNRKCEGAKKGPLWLLKNCDVGDSDCPAGYGYIAPGCPSNIEGKCMCVSSTKFPFCCNKYGAGKHFDCDDAVAHSDTPNQKRN